MNLEHAKETFTMVSDIIEPFCKRIDVAGSVRRGEQNPKDLEILCIPTNRTRMGMALMQKGIYIRKGQFSGRYIQFNYNDSIVDFFMPQEYDYFRQLAIRTGSSTYSKKIASKWVEKGYKGGHFGLLPKKYYENNNYAITPDLLVTWESEEDFFQWLGMDYLDPNERK